MGTAAGIDRLFLVGNAGHKNGLDVTKPVGAAQTTGTTGDYYEYAVFMPQARVNPAPEVYPAAAGAAVTLFSGYSRAYADGGP